MVILRSQNKITDFLMILAWVSPFKEFSDLINEHNDIFRTDLEHAAVLIFLDLRSTECCCFPFLLPSSKHTDLAGVNCRTALLSFPVVE